jgi:hypothetical protein
MSVYRPCHSLRQSVTAEAGVRSRVSLCGICGGQSGTGTGFSPSVSIFSCKFYSTGAPLQAKPKKKLIIFITGLHKKPEGCGASVASAAGPFSKKEIDCSLSSFLFLFLRYYRL